MTTEVEAPPPVAVARAPEPPSSFRLLKDGKEIMRGKEYDCWRWLHARHPNQSVAFATARMGYSIEPADV